MSSGVCAFARLAGAAKLAASSRRLLAPAVIAAFLSTSMSGARPDTITEYLVANAQTSGSPFGQSVTTTGGGPWTSITFNFYDGSNNAYAAGDLYLLTQEYTGKPASLSAATPGYVAVVAASGGTSWAFDPLVTLQPNTQYFFYMNSTPAVPLAVDDTAGYAGGTEYSVNGTAFSAQATNDLDFTLTGTQPSPGPIPGGGLLSYLVVGCGAAAAFRKRLLARAGSLRVVLKLGIRTWSHNAMCYCKMRFAFALL